MTGEPLLLAIDQGTSATKAVLVGGATARPVADAAAPLGVAHPRPGWVEQSPDEVWHSVLAAARTCLADTDPARVAGVALSTQRESLLLWERATGRPLGPLLGWQDRRTAEDCAALRAEGAGPLVRARTGLPLDPMFSALKARWLLNAHDPDRARARRGELCLGTVDSWLLWRLSGGSAHLVEAGNASRTQLLDVRRRVWDDELLALFDVPRAALPEPVSSAGPFPAVRGVPPLRDGTPVAAVLGDSHAALFGHGVFRPGAVKATYGTGSSVMGLLPAAPPNAQPAAGEGDEAGLCLTIAWQTADDDPPAYALEGNIRATGATLRWLARLLGQDEETLLARAAPDAGGVHLVPAFGGLAAPWWDNDATGLVAGLTLGTGAPELTRAALESIAFQVEDVIAAVDGPAGRVTTVLADGGPSANATLMQLQADISGRTVRRPADSHLSALGAAHLAARALGLLTHDDLARRATAAATDAEAYEPRVPAEERTRRRAAWHDAVARARLSPERPKDAP